MGPLPTLADIPHLLHVPFAGSGKGHDVSQQTKPVADALDEMVECFIEVKGLIKTAAQTMKSQSDYEAKGP